MFDNSIGGFSGILHPLWNWGADPLPFPPSKRQPEPQLYCTLRIGRRKAQRLAGRQGGSTVNIEGPALG
jgi:hypothetical protein